MQRDAGQKHALAPENHPQLRRLRAIAAKLIPFASRFNPRATQWKWEVSLIGSRQINAFCMPGGKIAFYTGILETLKLTDDEIAIVMGHAHAMLLPAMRDPVYRGVALVVRRRQGTRHGARAVQLDWLE